MDEKVNIFWHICELNNWRDVAGDQYETLKKSGLIEKADNVFVTFLGSDKKNINWLTDRDNKIQLRNYSPRLNHYERLCLNDLRDWSIKNDSSVLYMHNKGVSRKGREGENVWKWRKMMEYFLLENHERCLRELRSCDTVGGNLCFLKRNEEYEDLYRPGHQLHYSGNFWWARTSHLKSLPKIPEDVLMEENSNYIRFCEFWLLRPFPKMQCGAVYKTKKPHYYGSAPEPYSDKWI